jgi:AcrR family transcriptional regulator
MMGRIMAVRVEAPDFLAIARASVAARAREHLLSNKSATRRRPGQLRADVIQAAGELFRARGFEGTSMRDIASAAGTTQAMLYRYFPNKATLFKEAVLAPFHEFADEFLTALQTHSVSDFPNTELADFFNSHVYDLAVKQRKLILALLAAQEFSADTVGTSPAPSVTGYPLSSKY